MDTGMEKPPARVARRVRHELRFRQLDVTRVEDITPAMRRITLAGPDLAGFTSLSFDDHMKLFFPEPGAPLALPVAGPNGVVFPEGQPRPPARDYTPRRYDEAAGILEIDFALHENGPATDWASRARPGDRIGLGGPRGSFVIPMDFDWHLLVGDETALPAIGRRLEELPEGSHALVIAEVAGPEEEQVWRSQAKLDLCWVHRGRVPPGQGSGLEEALRALTLPDGEGYAWVACESLVAKRLRQILVERHGLPKERIKAAGYWKLGAAGAHETHND